MWKFSEKIHTEIFLGSRIASAGNKKDVILEKYKDDISRVKSNSRFNTIFISMILFFPAIIVVTTIGQSLDLLGQIPIEKILFTNSLAISSYYAFNLIFMLLFGLMTLSRLLEGSVFRFIHTLPLSNSEIQILSLLTFIRLMGFQLLIMFAVFPLGVLYITRSVIVFGVVLVLNTGNLILTAYVLIIVVDKMSSLFEQQTSGFNLRSILKYLFLLFYTVAIFSVYFLLQQIVQFFSQIYSLHLVPEYLMTTLNQYLPLVPFPFSTGYILTYFTIGKIPSTSILIGMILGFVLFVLLTWYVVSKGNQILMNIPFKEQKQDVKRDEEGITVELNTRGPLLAYLKVSLITLTRNLPSLLSITFTLLLPLLPLLQGTEQDLYVNLLFYTGFIMFFGDSAMASTEGSLGGLLSSLPFAHRSMYRGKQIVLGSIFFLDFIVLNLVTLGTYLSLARIVVMLMIIITVPAVYLIMKSYLFGKLNDTYTLYEIEDNSGFFKNLILIIPVLIVAGAQYYGFLILDTFFGTLNALGLYVCANIIVILTIEYMIRRMFEN